MQAEKSEIMEELVPLIPTLEESVQQRLEWAARVYEEWEEGEEGFTPLTDLQAEDWERRVGVLQRLSHEILTLPPSLHDPWLQRFLPLRTTLQGLILDLRSGVVRAACAFIVAVLQAVGPVGVPLGEMVMGELAKQCGTSLQFVTQSAGQALMALAAQSRTDRAVGLWLAFRSGAPGERAVGLRGLARVLRRAERDSRVARSLARGSHVTEEVLLKALQDAAGGVREAGREAWRALLSFSPGAAQRLAALLPPAAQRRLLDKENRPALPPTLPPSLIPKPPKTPKAFSKAPAVLPVKEKKAPKLLHSFPAVTDAIEQARKTPQRVTPKAEERRLTAPRRAPEAVDRADDRPPDRPKDPKADPPVDEEAVPNALRDAESPLWGVRVAALGSLGTLPLRPGEVGTVLSTVCAHLLDSHGKVVIGALEALSQLVERYPRGTESVMERLLPALFKLSHDPRPATRSLSAALLQLLQRLFPRDSLLPAAVQGLVTTPVDRTKEVILLHLLRWVQPPPPLPTPLLRLLVTRTAALVAKAERLGKLGTVGGVGGSGGGQVGQLALGVVEALCRSLPPPAPSDPHAPLPGALVGLLPLPDLLLLRRTLTPLLTPLSGPSPPTALPTHSSDPTVPSSREDPPHVHLSQPSVTHPLTSLGSAAAGRSLLHSTFPPPLPPSLPSTNLSNVTDARTQESVEESPPPLPERSPDTVGSLLETLTQNPSSVLHALLRVVRDSDSALVDQEGDKVLGAVLGIAEDSHLEPSVRGLALVVVQEVVGRLPPSELSEVTERVVPSLVRSSGSGEREVSQTSEETLLLFYQRVPPLPALLQLLGLLGTPGVGIRGWLKGLTLLIPSLPPSLLRAHLGEVLPPLVEGFKDANADIRKAVVFCLVDLYLSVGEDFLSYLSDLTPTQIKLVQIYYNRKLQQ